MTSRPDPPQSLSHNVALTVAYDGTDFHGFAESPDVATVMGTLRATLEQILQVSLDLTAAGRTDAGVHGWGQVVTGRLPGTADLDRLQRSVNRMCAPWIAIRSATWVDDSFDARFSATSRAYRYDVWNHPQPNPLVARTTWHVVEPLDLTAMNAAADHLLGQHDFASFCRRPKVADDQPEKSLVRILRRARWTRVALDDLTDFTGFTGFTGATDFTDVTDVADLRDPAAGPPALLRFDVAATSFCHQMVRSIVGTLVDVGRGRRAPDSIPAILAALDRSAAGPVAPPSGLVLWHVGYDGTRWDA